jgi:hypothetical protein
VVLADLEAGAAVEHLGKVLVAGVEEVVVVRRRQGEAAEEVVVVHL